MRKIIRAIKEWQAAEAAFKASEMAIEKAALRHRVSQTNKMDADAFRRGKILELRKLIPRNEILELPDGTIFIWKDGLWPEVEAYSRNSSLRRGRRRDDSL